MFSERICRPSHNRWETPPGVWVCEQCDCVEPAMECETDEQETIE